MVIRKQLTKLLIGICIMLGVMSIPGISKVIEIKAETVNGNDIFIYDGTNAAAYNGESVFVITEGANEGITEDMDSFEVAMDLSAIRNSLFNVKTIRIDDDVTDLYMYMLRFFEEATALHIGKMISSIHMGTEEDFRIEDYIKALYTIDVDDQNECFTVEDNVLYSLDMKTLFLYPPGKTDIYFTMPDKVINFAKPYMANSSLQKLKLGKSFGPLDTPYRDSGDFYYSFTEGLSSLQKITIDADNDYLSTVKGVLYDKSKTKTIAWPKKLVMEHVTFPSTLQSISLGMISNKEQVKTITLSRDMEKLWVFDFLSLLNPFTNLEKISVPVENEHYRVWKDGLYFKKDWTFCGFPQKSPLTILEFPKGCTVIELRGNYPNVDTIKLPGTFTKFYTHEGGGFARFYQMFPRLKNVQISSECKNYRSMDGVVFNKNGTQLIAYPVQKEGSSYRIPDSVEKIGCNGFSGSKNLKTLTIGKNLEANQSWYCEIEDSSISEFKTVKNSKNLTSKDGVLYDMKMTKIEAFPPNKKVAVYKVPDTVTDITHLYIVKSLENLYLGKKVKNFYDHSLNNIKSITVSKDNPHYMSKNGVLYNKKGTKVIYNPK